MISTGSLESAPTGATRLRETRLDYHRVANIGASLSLSGIPLRQLADKYGSPLYVIDADTLTIAMRLVMAELSAPVIRLFYSMKANATPSVVSRALQLGFGIDVCSFGDIHLAHLAGAAPNQLTYTGVGLRQADLLRLVSAKIPINLDSIMEVERLAACAPGTDVGVRVAPGIEAGFHPHCSSGTRGGKFGIDLDDLPRAYSLLGAHTCRLTRLHTHLGSSISSETPYLEALRILLESAEQLPDVSVVNLGGGLAARYHPDDSPFPLARLRKGILEQLSAFTARTHRLIQVWLEPGELLVSEAGHLLSKVLVTKVWRGTPDTRLAILDASMNLLPAHALYGSYLHVYLDETQIRHRDCFPWDLYGCTNQTGDRLANSRLLPDLVPDDLLVFRNSGAYAYCRSTQFNERPRPAELWLESGQAILTREAETVESLSDGKATAFPA